MLAFLEASYYVLQLYSEMSLLFLTKDTQGDIVIMVDRRTSREEWNGMMSM